MIRRADRKIANGPALAASVRSMLGAIALGCGLLLSAESARACDAGSACSQLDELLAAETQAETLPQNRSDAGVRITVEDDEIARVDTQGMLDSVDIQVKFDGLEITRELNVTVLPERRLISPGETLQFRGAWNYGPWIARAELRLFRAAEKVSALSAAVPVAVVPLDEDGRAEWNPAEAGFDEGEIAYTLRVYDPQGRFDETAPLVLKMSDRADDFQKPGSTGVIEGEDRTLFANIPLQGGKVTVYGREIPPGYAVYVMGQPVPVDGTGTFAASRIVPIGDHHVAVAVVPTSAGQKGLEFEREITIPDHELFYVGIIDATFGKRLGSESDLLHPAAPGEYDAVYNRGRVAFYLKGKVKGEYLITAAMDTREDELDELFTDFDRKDPRALLRRLDPDDYYPIYGDDSTTVEDAPTSGKFYVRIDKGQNHVMWGNFKVGFDGMELSRFDRAMYGAKAELRSDAVTSRGEPLAL